MGTDPTLRRRVLVTACAATGWTEPVARRLGAGPFLPALFAQRYANMGGLDVDRFRQEINRCRSFTDEGWSGYWDALAFAHLDRAQAILDEVADGSGPSLRDLIEGASPPAAEPLAATVAPYAELLADHGLRSTTTALARFAAQHPDERVAARAPAVAEAVAELLETVTYLQVSAFPGGTPARMRAYGRSRRLFDLLAAALAPGLDTIVEPVSIPAGAETVEAYRCLPPQAKPCPVVIITNGLEGTVQELLIPLLRYRTSGLGVLVMEMPGSYAYSEPLSPASEAVYRRVIDAVAGDPRVDASRIGIVGVSFGGLWAARMAAVDDRLVCAVACGAPTDRSFRPKLGLPEVIIEALSHVTGATTPIELLRRLRALSLRGMYGRITQPLLVINGDRDTLLSTRDSVELAAGAPNAELRLYPDDDHCAMGHYREWLDESQRWLAEHLLARS